MTQKAKHTLGARSRLIVTLALAGACVYAAGLFGGVLPEDRADAMYHEYKGGGVTIHGPSVLLRKKIGENVSVSGNYYVDSVTSASIDVVTTASKYSEKRTEESVSVDYLHGGTTMSGGYTTSSESDYQAKTANFSVSQDMFGDLTTLTLGYTRGWDEVGRNGDPAFQETADRRSYSVALSQILTKNLLVALSWEAVTDEGFLNNPYRSVRYADSSAKGYSYQAERYPNTHTSNAFAVRGRYYLPYRAAVHAEYRYYTDSWGIKAWNAELGYTHPIGERWILDLSYRYYTQTHADFYSDLFPYADAQNFLARDKELSTFTSQSIGFGATYQFLSDWHFLQKGTLNLDYNHVMYNYDDFRDLRNSSARPGQEPLYSYSANIIRLFISVWY